MAKISLGYLESTEITSQDPYSSASIQDRVGRKVLQFFAPKYIVKLASNMA